MRYTFTLIYFLLVAIASAQAPLFSASSKEQGAPFDLRVTEIERTKTTSVLHVPGFQDRTAEGTRWLMCAYTDLAMERGFSYWAVVYPSPPSEDIIVGLAKSATASIPKLFGPNFDKESLLSDDLMSVKEMAKMCGIEQSTP